MRGGQVLERFAQSPIASRLMCVVSLPCTVVDSLLSLTDVAFNEDEVSSADIAAARREEEQEAV